MAKRDGFHAAPAIPVGATVTGAYWTVPSKDRDLQARTAVGVQYETQAAAIRAGLDEQLARIERSQARPGNDGQNRAGQRIVVDYRWQLTLPDGQAIDTVVLRTTYETLRDAQWHVDKIERGDLPAR